MTNHEQVIQCVKDLKKWKDGIGIQDRSLELLEEFVNNVDYLADLFTFFTYIFFVIPSLKEKLDHNEMLLMSQFLKMTMERKND